MNVRRRMYESCYSNLGAFYAKGHVPWFRQLGFERWRDDNHVIPWVFLNTIVAFSNSPGIVWTGTTLALSPPLPAPAMLALVSAGYMFYRAWHGLHIFTRDFRRLVRVSWFVQLQTNKIQGLFKDFSRTFQGQKLVFKDQGLFNKSTFFVSICC